MATGRSRGAGSWAAKGGTIVVQRLLPSLIVVAGMAPMISLSLFSFVNGELWTTLTEAATLNYGDYPIWRIDVALLPVLNSWTTFAILGTVML